MFAAEAARNANRLNNDFIQRHVRFQVGGESVWLYDNEGSPDDGGLDDANSDQPEEFEDTLQTNANVLDQPMLDTSLRRLSPIEEDEEEPTVGVEQQVDDGNDWAPIAYFQAIGGPLPGKYRRERFSRAVDCLMMAYPPERKPRQAPTPPADPRAEFAIEICNNLIVSILQFHQMLSQALDLLDGSVDEQLSKMLDLLYNKLSNLKDHLNAHVDTFRLEEDNYTNLKEIQQTIDESQKKIFERFIATITNYGGNST